jgi:hypothetical protein
VRINRQRDIEEFLIVAHDDERVDVRRVRRMIKRDQRGIHVTGRIRRRGADDESERDGAEHGRCRNSWVCFHVLVWVIRGKSLRCELASAGRQAARQQLALGRRQGPLSHFSVGEICRGRPYLAARQRDLTGM